MGWSRIGVTAMVGLLGLGAGVGAKDCLVRSDGQVLEGTVQRVTGGYRLERDGRPSLFFRTFQVAAVLWDRSCGGSSPDDSSGGLSPAVTAGSPATGVSQKSPAAFRGLPLSLEVADADLRDLLEMLAQAGGFNVLLAPDVQGKVTLRVQDVPWDQLLDLVCRMYHLAYRTEGKVIVVASPDRLQKMYAIDP